MKRIKLFHVMFVLWVAWVLCCLYFIQQRIRRDRNEFRIQGTNIYDSDGVIIRVEKDKK